MHELMNTNKKNKIHGLIYIASKHIHEQILQVCAFLAHTYVWVLIPNKDFTLFVFVVHVPNLTRNHTRCDLLNSYTYLIVTN